MSDTSAYRSPCNGASRIFGPILAPPQFWQQSHFLLRCIKVLLRVKSALRCCQINPHVSNNQILSYTLSIGIHHASGHPYSLAILLHLDKTRATVRARTPVTGKANTCVGSSDSTDQQSASDRLARTADGRLHRPVRPQRVVIGHCPSGQVVTAAALISLRVVPFNLLVLRLIFR